jgi:energy-coupling factor transport system ATP-binding protein
MQIKLQGVHYTYPGGVQALKDVTLWIEPAEHVALVGRNGSGKTTLARHLNGLLRPQGGSVWVGDWLTSDHSPARLAQRVAYVFQNPDEQLFCRRIWDEVAFGPRNLGYDRSKVKALVEQALSSVRLDAQASLNPRDLGLADRKLVTLAAALAMDTPVVIFDEPTAGLDANQLEMLAQILQRLRQEKTVLVISHDMDFVAENLDRIILMDAGQVTVDASAQEFFGYDSQIESAGIHLPQMVRLSRNLGQSKPALKVDQFFQVFGVAPGQ